MHQVREFENVKLYEVTYISDSWSEEDFEKAELRASRT
jgi:hypothetical protein